METRLLIDAIVQQTTLLIAQLATRAGLRAPLAHIADQVFVELSREIEQQGISRNVAADMFGLALRSYQKKVTRLRGSVTQSEKTLWQSVLEFISARGRTTRGQVLIAFRGDEEAHVIAVLNDLVASGLLYGTGRGQHAAYKAILAHEQNALLDAERLDAVLHLVWLEIADRGSTTRAELTARFAGEAELVDRALTLLVADGRIERGTSAGEGAFQTSRVTIPIGAEAGWESAVLDHFRAMCVAIASKLNQKDPAAKRDLIGGTTLSFDLHPDHPYAEEAKALLKRFREQANDVWNRVAAHNQQHPVPEASRTKLVFYFGQNLIEPGVDVEVA